MPELFSVLAAATPIYGARSPMGAPESANLGIKPFRRRGMQEK
jgi:hypothetical protein